MILARILSGIAAAGVVWAGIVLWRMIARSQVTWIRRTQWLVSALVGYGALSFIYAATLGVSVREALAGRGLLQALPPVLQGVFIGGFVILPLGCVAAIIRAGIPRFRERASRPIWFQAVALTTCLALLITSLELRLGERHLKPEERIALLDKSLRALEDGDREMPRDTWDPNYVVNMVGRDPQRLFRWVQHNTYWIPYHGVLRGPIGVLMDRQGNSLDRAILLATLLEKAGHAVRLAHGELNPSQVNNFLPELAAEREIAFDQETKGAGSNTPDLRLVSAQYGFDNIPIQQNLSTAQAEMSQLATEARARTKDQSGRLLASLSRPTQTAEWAQRYEHARASLTDHWWVQQQEGEKWIDFDLLYGTSSPGSSAAGTALASASSTIPVHDLSADLFHAINIHVVAERASRGKLDEHAVFEYPVRPADVIGKSIVLRIWPTAWLPNTNDSEALSRNFDETVLAQQSWGTALAIDGRVAASGTLLANGDDPKAPQRGGAMGGMADAFATTMGSGPQKQQQGELSALWIEYEIRVPGEKPRKIRRAVFDLLGADARASGNSNLAMDNSKRLARNLALLMRTEILPVSCRFSPEFLMHLAAQSVIGNRELINSAIRGDFQPGTAASDALLQHMAPIVSRLYTLAEARTDWSNDSDSLYVNEPQLLTSHSYPAPSNSGVAIRDVTDIVANNFGVSLTVRDGFAARLSQGVFDTNLEAFLHIGVDTFGNAGEAYAKSRAWSHLGDESQTASLNLPGDSRRSISEDLASGYEVEAPPEPISMPYEDFAGWWRVDPNTGNTLGMGANGWGQGGEEAVLDTEAAAKEPLWIQMSRSGWEGFASDYSWCVAWKMYTTVNDETVVVHKHLIAVAVSSPHECGKHAIMWGIVSAVFPLFIALWGKYMSRWFNIFAPGAARAARWAAGRGKPLLGGNGGGEAVGGGGGGAGPEPKGGGSNGAGGASQGDGQPGGDAPGAGEPNEPGSGSDEANPSNSPDDDPCPSTEPAAGGAPEPVYGPSPDHPLSPEDYQKWVDYRKYEFSQAQSELATAKRNVEEAQATLDPLQKKWAEADKNLRQAERDPNGFNPRDPAVKQVQDEYVAAAEAKQEAAQDLAKAKVAQSKAQTNYNIETKRANYATDPTTQKANAEDWQAQQDFQQARQQFGDWQAANPGKLGTQEYYEQFDKYFAAKQRAEDASLQMWRHSMFGDSCGSGAGMDPTQGVGPGPDPTQPGMTPDAADPFGKTQPGVSPDTADPFGGTQPGANPQRGVDPLGKTQPGADPMGNTSPGADPLGQTQSGADPLSKTQPGTPPTQRSPQGGSGPSGSASGSDEPIPPTQPGAPPTQSRPADPGSPPTQRSPQNYPIPGTPALKTLTGIGGALAALGGK